MIPYPQEHIWMPLSGIAQEKETDYGLYTYVLSKQDLTDDEASKKYKKLIEIIKTTTSSYEDLKTNIDYREKDFNVFLIPYKKSEIDTELSKKYISIFLRVTTSEKIKHIIRSHPGPFLITTPVAIERLKTQAQIPTLYLDLTNVNINAIKEIISAYKTRITSAPIDSEEKFKSIKISLLNILLNADECLNIAKAVYAEWKDVIKD